LELLGMTQIKWPGGGLSDDQPYQFVKGEYMKRDEYDEILSDPSGFVAKKLWSRISTVLTPLSGMAQMPPPPLAFLSNTYTLPSFVGEIASAPPIKDLLRRMREVTMRNGIGTALQVFLFFFITERTVNFHVRNILAKLNAVTRAQAVAIAMEEGLIDVE
jgi:hypothetical protein